MNRMEKILLLVIVYLFSQELFGINYFVPEEQAKPFCGVILKKYFSPDTVVQLKKLLLPAQINQNSFCMIGETVCDPKDAKKDCWQRLGVTIPSHQGRRPPRIYHFYVEKETGRVSKDNPHTEVLRVEPQDESSNH